MYPKPDKKLYPRILIENFAIRNRHNNQLLENNQLPWYISRFTAFDDLHCPCVSEEMHSFSKRYWLIKTALLQKRNVNKYNCLLYTSSVQLKKLIVQGKIDVESPRGRRPTLWWFRSNRPGSRRSRGLWRNTVSAIVARYYLALCGCVEPGAWC